ncbi:helix-turn-helix domain-containing protein [Streptomyces sp. URMC 126]|uniref:helix-turn-helix domain-containing protein n=1 Tax=Streptomyces sp. URMC 126 TaxID=3423401 RepID=UPI003F194768
MLDDARFTDACARRDMGAVFRMLNHRGISTRRIAELAGVSQGRLYDYMNGKSRVEKPALFEEIADGLRIPGKLLRIADRPWEPHPEPPGPEERTAPAADDVTAVNAFREVDKSTGGGRVYQAVVRHLHERVARRLVASESDTQSFAAAASFSEMAGWMAHDSGRDDLAAGHLTRALHLARVSGDWSLSANIAASSSHLALQTGDALKAAHWASVGLGFAAKGPDLPALSARLLAMGARAAAAGGRPAAAVRCLAQSQEALERSPSTTHPWVSPFDTTSLASEAALAMRDMASYGKALAYAEHATESREGNRVRSLALNRINLVSIHARRNDWDAVVHHGTDLPAISPALGSVRVMRHMSCLRHQLLPHRAYPPLRELVARMDDFGRTQSLLLADLVPEHDEGAQA